MKKKGSLYTNFKRKEKTFLPTFRPDDPVVFRDEGLELPGCWTVTLKRLGGGAGNSRPTPSGHVYP